MRELRTPILALLFLGGCPGHRTALARQVETPLTATGVEDFRVGSVESDRRDVPLGRVADLVSARLKSAEKEGLLRGLPDSFTLKLTLSTAGAVTAAYFDRPCGSAGAGLQARALTWRFEAWSVAGETRLSI